MPKPKVILRLSLRGVHAGAEVIIEQDAKPVAVIIPTLLRPGRLLSEAIAMAEARGSTTTLDEDFSHDLEDIIKVRSLAYFPA